MFVRFVATAKTNIKIEKLTEQKLKVSSTSIKYRYQNQKTFKIYY